MFVGYRGMGTAKNIEEDMVDREDCIKWLVALNALAIKRLVADKSIVPGLFDEKDLF